MNVITTELSGVLILEPKVFGDARGFFFESYNARKFAEATGIQVEFVQDNHSRSRRGVLRGLHYQEPHPQGKLVRVAGGAIWDVVVDIRPTSATYGRHLGLELSEENQRQLWIPPGFAHGFLVLSEVADFLYKTSDYWYPEHERCIAWDDATLNIPWPLEGEPALSQKDRQGQPFMPREG